MEELVEFVNDIVDDEETIFVEMPAHPQYSRLIDDEVVDIIRRQTGHNDPSSFQQLDRETQNNLLVSLKKTRSIYQAVTKNNRNRTKHYSTCKMSRRTVP